MYANEVLEVAQEPVVRQTPIMGLRLGDLGIVGLPGEIFVEYACRSSLVRLLRAPCPSNWQTTT